METLQNTIESAEKVMVANELPFATIWKFGKTYSFNFDKKDVGYSTEELGVKRTVVAVIRPTPKKDILGNEINTGDILLEPSGYNMFKGYKYTFQIWQKPYKTDSSAIAYHKNGEPYIFKHGCVVLSKKINIEEMPEGFHYAFLHGMDTIGSTINEGTVKEIINNSNWKTLCK